MRFRHRLRQNIIVLNLSTAGQLRLDLALHRLSATRQTTPATMGAAFDELAQSATIAADLARRLKSAVDVRSLAVSQYEAMDWRVVRSLPTIHLDDFRMFARVMAQQTARGSIGSRNARIAFVNLTKTIW